MSFSSDPALLANQLPISLQLPNLDQPELFVEQVELFYKRIANSVNTKEGALYQLLETATFQQYFTTYFADQRPNFRPVYRKTIDFGTLPNTGTKSVAHGINFTSTFTTTRIYGSATDPVGLQYLALPYASPTDANNIELYVDATNVTIITGSNRSAFTRCTVVIEYTKVQP